MEPARLLPFIYLLPRHCNTDPTAAQGSCLNYQNAFYTDIFLSLLRFFHSHPLFTPLPFCSPFLEEETVCCIFQFSSHSPKPTADSWDAFIVLSPHSWIQMTSLPVSRKERQNSCKNIFWLVVLGFLPLALGSTQLYLTALFRNILDLNEWMATVVIKEIHLAIVFSKQVWVGNFDTQSLC